MNQQAGQQVESSGLAARRVAADIIDGVLRKRRPLDDLLSGPDIHPGLANLEDRDRGLVRMLAATVLRRLGSLRRLLDVYLDSGVPPDAPRVETALLLGAAQILWLDVPDHAAVDLSVRLVQADRRSARYPGLVNAVLRRVAREGRDYLTTIEEEQPDIPAWLFARWRTHYGDQTAQAIASALKAPPPLDLTVKDDAESWASRLRGHVLPTGTVRTLAPGLVSLLPGFNEGAWWVQDAAAAIPVRLLGDVRGRSVADLCAAPGGKAAQLVVAGAEVTSVDRAARRMATLESNFARLGLSGNSVIADATLWDGGPFDAVLLDAPCTSTGTIRRHPDIAWLKGEADIAPLADLQTRLLDRAVGLVRPGGVLVFCTCSLEPEEGEHQIAALLARNPDVRRAPITPGEINGLGDLLTEAGDLRTLPCHFPNPDPRLAGLDGFYAARLQRT